MDRSEKRKAISFLQYFCQGMLLVSSPFLFFSLNVGSSLFFSQGMRVFFCILSIILFFSGSQLLFHHAVAARTLIASGIVFNLAAALPALYRIPACALFYGLIFISLLFRRPPWRPE